MIAPFITPLLRFALGGVLLLATAAQAAEVRPRVGLVLGGGGARGAAHIGVLEVLQALHVPVDCVAGTSMGGLVAGAYAAGLTPEMMQASLSKVDWRDMFQDNPPFSELSYRNRVLSKRFLPGSETGISKDGLQYQPGVVSGQKLSLFFNQLVRANMGERNIDALQIPVSIIATDLGTGDRVVFRKGSLTNAMRASMSVPGLMAPAEIDGRKLVDGGLVDNVPIGEARERCNADVVIVVNVGSPLLKPEAIGSLLTVSAQMVNILTQQNVNHSLSTLKPGDIYIQPDLDGISAADFPRHVETAGRGRKAAEAVIDQLRRLSVSESEYTSWWAKIESSLPTVEPRIDEIQIADLKRINPALVRARIQQRLGDPLDTAQLDSDLMRLYGEGDYQGVDYSILDIRDRNILRVLPVEKPWGPDYLRFAFGLESTNANGSTYNLRGAYQKTWLNDLGGQFLVVGQIGNNHGIGVEVYQPLDVEQRFFVEPTFSSNMQTNPIYQNNNKIAEYQTLTTIASLSLGATLGLIGQTRLGWRETYSKSTVETGAAALPSGTNRFGGGYLSANFDQMDRIYFPTRGWSTKFEYFSPTANDYSKITTSAQIAYPLGNTILSIAGSYEGSPRGTLPYYDAAKLGGLFHLSAYSKGQLVGDDVAYGQFRAEQIIGHLPLGLRGDMRMGVALEAGKVKYPYTETQLSGWLNSAMVYLGGETPIGPIYLGYARSTTGSSNLYLSIGVP